MAVHFSLPPIATAYPGCVDSFHHGAGQNSSFRATKANHHGTSFPEGGWHAARIASLAFAGGLGKADGFAKVESQGCRRASPGHGPARSFLRPRWLRAARAQNRIVGSPRCL